MKTNLTTRRQRGAVAILVALTLCSLIGLLGLVIDLGHQTVRKTELQNAADAAALAGGRELNGKDAGIDAAVQAAVAMAALNASDFAHTAVSLGEPQITFASSPDGPWLDVATARATPAGLSFIKVDTQGIAQGTRATWFAPILAVFSPASASALASTTANGVAVAGAELCDGVPIFICPPTGGFVPGQAYFFADNGGKVIGPGNIGYFDPVLTGAPSLITGSDEMRDIICAGKTQCLGAGTYSSLTQSAFGTLANAFNTRFDDYSSLPTKLTPEICRPDSNVQEYPFGKVNWLSTNPTTQDGSTGVRWAALRPSAVATGEVNASYPADGTPYSQRSGPFFKKPAASRIDTVQDERRVLTMAIGAPAACDGSVNGSGKPVEISGFGRFFLTIKAKGTGSPKGIYVEYLEPVDRLLPNPPDIKLYR